MQSTGHSSMHALSLISTQGSAIVYVTKVSSTPDWGCGSVILAGLAEKAAASMRCSYRYDCLSVPLLHAPPVKRGAWLLILDVAHTSRLVAPPLRGSAAPS